MGEQNDQTKNVLGLDNIILDVSNDNIEDILENKIIGEDNSNETNDTSKLDPGDSGKETLEDNLKDINANGIGGLENIKVEDTEKNKNIGNSPLSSLANALFKDGVLTNLKEEEIKTIKTADDFAAVFEKEIQSRIDEKTRRIDEALNLGVEPSEIKKNENLIQYLNGISEDIIKEETEQATQLRMNLIVQDFMNKGFTQERAIKEANKSIAAGSDIDDALEALESNKTHFNKQYSDLINAAKKEQEEYKQTIIQRDTDVKENILKNEKLFADMNVTPAIRKLAVENIQKPVFTDKEGNKFSAIQKYEKENPVDFLSKVALFYTITDGFTNIDKITNNTKGKIKSKALNELAGSLADINYGLDNSLSLANNLGSNDDENDKGDFVLDIKQ
jgi:hypothetical protein